MQLLSQVIRLTDHTRYDPGDSNGRRQQYKEWFHFCILGPQLDLVINFNLTGAELARVIVLLHVADSDGLPSDKCWTGEVVQVAARDVQINPSHINLRCGQNFLRFEKDHFHLSVALVEHPLTLDLRLRPITYPLLRNKAAIGEGTIDWLVVPRLVASGLVVSGQQVYRLQDAPAYHDHNWGHWLWGQDFAWEWGFALPIGQESQWSLVFDRVTDRARNQTEDLKLCLWKGDKLARIFTYADIQVRREGYFSPHRIPKYPPIMALVAPEATTDVPQHLVIEAAAGDDRIHWQFEAKAMAQIIVPNETDLLETIINEVTGTINVTGQVMGEQVHLEGNGFFEFLT
jgi:hypothetical protein